MLYLGIHIIFAHKILFLKSVFIVSMTDNQILVVWASANKNLQMKLT